MEVYNNLLLILSKEEFELVLRGPDPPEPERIYEWYLIYKNLLHRYDF